MLTKTKPQPVGEYTLPLQKGEQAIPNTDISICISKVKNASVLGKSSANAFVLTGEWEDLQEHFTWRNRRQGDVILRGGMHRQIRRLWAQAGIPTELRCALPLLCRDGEIVWAPFVGMSDSLKEKNAGADEAPAWKMEINVSDNAF